MKRPWKIGLLLSLAVFGAVLFNLLISPLMAKAVNPTTLSFQGKVVNANGTNVTDGTYSFLFKLYTVSSAGTAVWSETQASTTVTAGTFQVNLGSVCPFFTANACNNSTPIDFNANPNLYLGITFNGDAAGEMSPRVQLQSVPYAFNSDKVGGFTAAQLVQLSPGSQQTGFVNVSGAGTFGNSLTVSAGSVTIGAFTSAGIVHSSSAGLLSDSAVVLGTETSGNYVATLGALTGLATTGNTGAGSTPTLSVTYGSSANMAVQGNVTLTCPSGSGNLTGGGTAITLGTGGTCAAISTNAAVSFGTSVTTPLVTSSAGLAITGGTTLALSSTGANTVTLDTGGAAGITIAGTNANALTIGNVTTNPTILFSGSGTFGTTTGAVNLNGATTVTGTNTFTVNNGLTTLGGNLTFSGTAARSITGPTSGGLTINDTGGNLTLSTTTTGTLAVTSAGALNLTGAAASTLNIGANTLAVTSSNFNVSTAGIVTLAGAQTQDVTTATAGSANGITVQPGISSAINGTGASLALKAGDQSGTTCSATNCTGGSLTIQGGSATGGAGTTRNGGNVTIDAGTGASANGTLSVGTANAASISLGRTSITTTNNGAFTVTQALAANGTVSVAANQSVTLQSGTGVFTQSFSNSVASSANVLNVTNTNAGAGVIMQGFNITPTNTTVASTPNTINVINFAAGGALGANLTNGINFASATGYTNFIKTPSFNLSNSGAISGVTTIGLSGAISGDTATNTINGLIINAGALSGISTIATSGSINSQTISSAANFTGTVNAVTGYKINGTTGSTIAACNNGQSVVSMQVTGGIVVAGVCGQDAALSDQRLKTNIVSLDNSILDNIKNVNSVAFDFDCSLQYWTDSNTLCDSTHQIGVIAQQLAQVFPELVHQNQFGYYEVNYKGLSVYTLKAVSEIAQHLDSQGNANLSVVTANSLTVNGDLKVNGSLTYSSLTTPTGKFSTSVITPLLVSNGALQINSGSAADVSIDSGDSSGSVKIGATNAASIDISRPGATTSVKGALVVDGPSDFRDSVTMHFNAPTTTFKIDNSGSTGAVDAAIQITDSAGSGYTKLISTPNFGVSGSGDISTNGSIISKGGALQLLDPAGQLLISFDQAGNGNLKGNLNLASASLSGGLSVGGDANFAGLSTFQKLATFLGKTIFRQDVQFDGHITVASDTAGYATLRSGESSVHVTFKVAYDSVPIVNANIINGQFGNAGVNNITATGFDISLPAPATGAMTLSWTALAVNNPQTAANPAPAPTPTPITATTTQSPNSGPVTTPTTP